MPERVRPALLELTVVRLKEFWRDPAAMFWTFGFPAILAIALGLAFRSAPAPPPRVALVCPAAGCGTVQARLAAADALEVRRQPRPQALPQALLALRRGRVDLVVEVERPGAAPVALAYHFDPTRVEARAARLAVDAALTPDREPAGRRLVPHEEPGGRYIDFLVPGLIGLNVMGSAIWGVGFAIVESRKRKMLKQLAGTPMRRSHFLLSYMFSRLVFLVVEVAFLLAFGYGLFGVPVRGSLAAVAVLSVVGSFTFTGVGLLVASRAHNTEVAAGWANFAMLPMWLLSGAFFSYERFPEWLHDPIRLLPLTALNDALRAVMLEGASLWQHGPELAVLAGWAALSFAAALWAFRWQ